MKRVTADTNIWISALIFGRKPQQLLELAIDGEIELAISGAIVKETLRVLREDFKRTAEQLRQAEGYMTALTRRVEPTEMLDAVKADPTDNKILECAVAAGSEVIVSGDKHLLALRSFRGIDVMTVSDFLQRGAWRSR